MFGKEFGKNTAKAGFIISENWSENGPKYTHLVDPRVTSPRTKVDSSRPTEIKYKTQENEKTRHKSIL